MFNSLTMSLTGGLLQLAIVNLRLDGYGSVLMVLIGDFYLSEADA